MEKDLNSSPFFFVPSANRANMLFLGNNKLIFPGQRTMMIMEDKETKKRPILTSPDEILYDDEYYYDEQLPEKKRRLSPEQVVLLEKSFQEENRLEPERKSELARKLGLQPRQVAVWFQNRRARSKAKKLEREYHVLKAAYDKLRSDYDSLAKKTAMLEAKLRSKKEKLKDKDEKNVVGLKTNLAHLWQLDGPMLTAQEKLIKVEDRQSSGSGGSASASAVENGENIQMVMHSTGDSYFGRPQTSPPFMAVVHLEEDDINDDGRSYFPNIFNAASVDHHHHYGHEQEEELGWWVWS